MGLKKLKRKGKYFTLNQYLFWFLLFFVSCPFYTLTSKNLVNETSADSLSKRSIKRKILWSSGAVIYGASVTGLYSLWYKDYNTGRFHFFNDNSEWLGMDKCGHFFSAYYLGKATAKVYKWGGYNPEKVDWIGSATGLMFLSTVELMDGFSEGWGFSWGDMAANTGGYLFYALQQHFWHEQRLSVKFSYWPQNEYSNIRPNLLGNNFSTRLLKNYNAQTYWLCLNPRSFLKNATFIPKCIDVCFGYGANGMVGANDNKWTANNGTYDFTALPRYRQYYVSIDLNLQRLPFKSTWLKSLSQVFGFIHLPFPALEFSRNNIQLSFN